MNRWIEAARPRTLPLAIASILLGNTGNSVVLAMAVTNVNVAYLQARQKTGTGAAFDISLNPLGGNVGIGTTTPLQKLDVVGTIRATTEASVLGNVTGGLIAQRTSNDSVLYFGFRTTPDAWVIGASYATTGAYKPIILATSDTARMSVLANGNVGIGTITPNTKAEVYGLETVNRTSYSDILTISAGANTNPYTGHGGGILFRARRHGPDARGRRDVDRAAPRRRAGRAGSVAPGVQRHRRRGALAHHRCAGGTGILARLKINRHGFEAHLSD